MTATRPRHRLDNSNAVVVLIATSAGLTLAAIAATIWVVATW